MLARGTRPPHRTIGALMLLCTAAFSFSQTSYLQAQTAGEQKGVRVRELLAVRNSYLDHWRELEAGGLVGLERFASTVQRVVDTRASSHPDSPETAVRLILDDLVDLFVDNEFRLEKALVMSTPSVLADDALSEQGDDLSGFALRFRAGEGRFRHFALNAAAAYSAPNALVDLAARLRGRDLRSSSPDSRADRATNLAGRAFARLLRERPLAEIADGKAVRSWLLARFGE